MIHIDSSIRDYRTYTKSSDFQITVNAKPSENDVRYQSKIRTDIEYLFQWVGNSEFNNPISKVKNDTFLTKIIPISSSKCIIVAGNELVEKLMNQMNYFVGIKVWFDYSNKFSTVIAYDHLTKIASMESNIFQYYFENINYNDFKEKTLNEFYRNAYFINTSKHFGTNIHILGVDKEKLTGYIVENVTKRWKSTLLQKNQEFYLERKDVDFDLLDIFIVYRSLSIERLLSLNFTNEIIEKKTNIEYGFRTTDYIGYITNLSTILCLKNIYSHSTLYIPITVVEDDIVYLPYNLNLLENFNMYHYVLSVLPYENIFPSLLIDRNLYRNNVYLSLDYMSIPNKILQSIHADIKLEQIPYLTIKINKELLMTNVINNIPNMESSFICYTENTSKNDFILFKSSQKIKLKEIFRHSINISILLPNNKPLLFENNDFKITTNGQKIIIDNFDNIISIVFQLNSI